jgi:Holliday junction resolvase RusA-like endonuclease
MRIKIKPLSTNVCWYGKRIKTDAYQGYETELGYQLPNIKIPEKICIKVMVGFSSKGSDLDNCLKPMIDIMQKKYGFNDNRIYRIEIEKQIVKKGEEFIDFEFKDYETCQD